MLKFFLLSPIRMLRMVLFEAGGLQFNGSATPVLTSKAFADEGVPLNCREVPFCNNRESSELNRDFRRNFCKVHHF